MRDLALRELLAYGEDGLVNKSWGDGCTGSQVVEVPSAHTYPCSGEVSIPGG